MAGTEPGDLILRLAPRALLRGACIVIVVLVGLNLARALPGPSADRQLWLTFSLDSESSLGTLYAVVQLAACAVGALVVAWVLRRRGLPWAGHWTALAVLLALVMADEVLALHEWVGTEIGDALDTGGPLHYAWVIPGTVVVAALVVTFWRFVAALPLPIRVLVVAAAGTFIVGAIGFEMVSAWIVDTHGRDNPGQVLAYTAEETLELVGVAVLGYATARYLAEHLDPVWLTTASADPPAR